MQKPWFLSTNTILFSYFWERTLGERLRRRSHCILGFLGWFRPRTPIFYMFLWFYCILVVSLSFLFPFHYWDDSWISLVISGYMWWFEVVSFNCLLGFYLSKRWVFIVFRSNEYIWWLGEKLGIFCDLFKEQIHWMI